MTAPVPIDVGWALWGKHPGTRIDYSVLACSAEPLTEAEFTYILTHFVVGTPSTEPNRPDSLPWVIVSRVGVADQPYLGISIQAPAGTKDAAGRPVISTSYFSIPYAAISGAPVTYSWLYHRLDQDVRLPYRDDGLIPVSVPRLDPGDLIRDAEKLGESVVRTTTACSPGRSASSGPRQWAYRATGVHRRGGGLAPLRIPYRLYGCHLVGQRDAAPDPAGLRRAARQNAGVIRWKAGPATPLTGAGEDTSPCTSGSATGCGRPTSRAPEQLTKLIARWPATPHPAAGISPNVRSRRCGISTCPSTSSRRSAPAP